jgi:transcriptional regulator with XRE-family HTH domain
MASLVDVTLLKIIGARMRDSRELAGYSQIKAAKLLGYKNSSRLNKIECASDVSTVPVGTIIRAANTYDVSADYLLGLSDDWERDSRVAQCRDVSKFLMSAWEQARQKDLNAMRILNAKLDAICRAMAVYDESSTECRRAIARFAELNPEFEDMRGGAMIVGSMDRACGAVAHAQTLLKRVRLDAALWGDANSLQVLLFADGDEGGHGATG